MRFLTVCVTGDIETVRQLRDDIIERESYARRNY